MFKALSDSIKLILLKLDLLCVLFTPSPEQFSKPFLIQFSICNELVN